MLRLAFALFALAFGLAACATAPASRPWPVASAPAPAPIDPAAPHILGGGAGMQCAPYARQASGIELYGDANTWWDQAAGRYPRSGLPAAGAVLVMRGYNDPTRGHVAVVVAVVSARLIKVNQANWLNQGEISVEVPVADVSPNNDWTQVRVWHIPSGQWGARVYEAQGFIHPIPFFPTAPPPGA